MTDGSTPQEPGPALQVDRYPTPPPRPSVWSRHRLGGPLFLAALAFVLLAIGQFSADAAYTHDNQLATTAGKAAHLLPGIAYLVLAGSSVLIAILLTLPDGDRPS